MKKRVAAGLLVLATGFAFLFASTVSTTTHVAETHPPIPFSIELS